MIVEWMNKRPEKTPASEDHRAEDSLEFESRLMKIETELEADGRWIADVPTLPGVMAYGESRQEAVMNVKALALEIEEERRDWFQLAAYGLARAYGEDEPEYSEADCIKE